NGGVVRRKGVKKKRKIIDERVVNTETRAHRSCAVSFRIPRQSDPWANQMLRLVIRERGTSKTRIRQKHTIGVGDIIGCPSRNFIPTRREFVSKAGTK